MRWGVRDEATDDHMTTELCMREIVKFYCLDFYGCVINFKLFSSIHRKTVSA
jgi:hypothetical protein